MSWEFDYGENLEKLSEFLTLNKIVPFKIKHITCTAGSSSGDNYMSVIKRIHVTNNECENNKAQKISIIIKRQIASLSRRLLYRCDEAFYNEINAYKYIVPLLERHSTESLFPSCYFAGIDCLGEIIVLEDLKTLGFGMQNRLVGLDLSYCVLVMKQLAKLHAASIAAKQLNGEIFNEKCKKIQEIVYCKEAEDFYRTILEASVDGALISLRASNVDGCLTEPIRLIQSLQKTLYPKIQNYITNAKENLCVVCHGDLWVNNIMFKLSTSNDSSDENLGDRVPCAVKFFDLQAMRYTSFVFDLLHFIYTSTKREFRDSYTNTLLETYSTALLADLEIQFRNAQNQLNLLKSAFSLRNITNEYFEHVLYGLAISMWILPAVTFDPNNIPNLDMISEMNTSAKEINCTQKLTPEYHSRMKDLALEFYQNGYFDSNPFNN